MKFTDIIKIIETDYKFKTTKQELLNVLTFRCVLNELVEQLKYIKLKKRKNN
jgi:hypothetical protein